MKAQNNNVIPMSENARVKKLRKEQEYARQENRRLARMAKRFWQEYNLARAS